MCLMHYRAISKGIIVHWGKNVGLLSFLMNCNFLKVVNVKRKSNLKPQDGFGEFKKKILDLQKVQEIIRKHHQTFLQLCGMTYCHYVHNLWQSVRGDSEHFYVWFIS